VGGTSKTRERGRRGTEENRSREEIPSGEGCDAAQWWMMIMISYEHCFTFYSIYVVLLQFNMI